MIREIGRNHFYRYTTNSLRLSKRLYANKNLKMEAHDALVKYYKKSFPSASKEFVASQTQ